MRKRFRSTAIAILLATPCPRAFAADPAPRPIRALLVTGGCCHDYTAQKDIIAKGLAERAHIEFTVVQQGGTATNSRIPLYENPDWAKGYDIVLHDECFAEVKDRAWTAGILKPHREGLPGVVIHCAMHCYRDGSDNWFEFCGVTSRGHGAAYPHEVRNRDPQHPVMKEFGPAWANPAGELYWIEKVWPTAHALASSKNRENGHDEVCVWTNVYRKTRVFGTTLGHHKETVDDPAFLDLLTRGTLWACDKLNPTYLKPAKPRVAHVNIARGKRATASSEEAAKGNLASHAVDGKLDTRWCAADAAAGQWLEIDLGEPTKLTGFRLDWEAADAAYRYKVEGSKDRKAWQVLAESATSPQAGPSSHDLPGISQRFVRVTFLGSSSHSWGSLREVQIFGEAILSLEPKRFDLDKEQSVLGSVRVPAGFDATLYASPPAVNYPVFVAAAPNGDLYVSSDRNGSIDRQPHRGSVVRLRDIDGDGRADESKLFVPDVDSPRGLVWDHDRLYLMHPPHLSAFIDRDGDGIADEEKVLVKNIAFGFKDRPADHTSNGVTLGVDGWLYLAIGDFGFLQAEGTEGRKLELRGGGVVRVRPDGTGLELYSRGTRNILEVAVDPLLNAFARDNTNDGGGWDIRLHHFSGMEDHGYPSLFKNFTDEVIPPLADYGGGSGCGALFLSEPGLPADFTNALYTADWGQEQVFRHRLSPNGATFRADQQPFLGLARVTDLDVDASSRIYASSWHGATFTYAGEDVGFLVRLAPKGYAPDPLPDFGKVAPKDLVRLLKSSSHRRRLEAQRSLVRHGLDDANLAAVRDLAADRSASLASRVAAVFAIKQGLGAKSADVLAGLAADPTIREYAIRALADRADQVEHVSSESIVRALKDASPRVRLQAAVGVARLGRKELASALAPLLADSDPVVVHTTIRALASLHGVEACFRVIDDTSTTEQARVGAIRALQLQHDVRVVDGLLKRLDAERGQVDRLQLIDALCRLDRREGDWNGESWGTRPETSGPYYQPQDWEGSPRIRAALTKVIGASPPAEFAATLKLIDRNKVRLDRGWAPILARVDRAPDLIPPVVDSLAASPSVPIEALPFLLRASKDASSLVRARAVIALTRLNNADAMRTVIHALSSHETAKRDEAEWSKAKVAFLSSPHLAGRIDCLLAEAGAEDSPASTWADAGLLTLATEKSQRAEIRDRASQALEEGWKGPKRRARILHAVALAENHASRERVLSALGDPAPDVAAAARVAAQALKLDLETAHGRSSAPRIGTMPMDSVLDSVASRRGERSLGEGLFSRLNCIACHTVRADDPAKGPYLGSIAKTYKRKELAEAILAPSKTIAQGFTTNLFALEDGRTLAGFVVQEAADSVKIRTGDAKEIDLPTSTIVEREKQATSVMPEGLVKDLTVREFASLIDYLESLPGNKP